MLEQLVEKNRSYRRFSQEERIPPEFLRYLVSLARITPQPATANPCAIF